MCCGQTSETGNMSGNQPPAEAQYRSNAYLHFLRIRPVSWLAVIRLHAAFPVSQWRLHGFVGPTVAGAAPE